MFNTPTRNHITVVAERLGFVFVMLAVVAVNFLQQSLEGDFSNLFSASFWRYMLDSAAEKSFPALIGAVALVAAVIFVVLISLRFWSKTSFYISGTDFIYTRSTFFKKTSRLPMQNIASVNLERSIFERIVGTAKVKLDLNSSHTADRTDFAFVLKLPQAQELRSELLRLRERARSGAESAQPPEYFESAEDAARAAGDGFVEVIHFPTALAFRHKLLSIPFMQTLVAVSAIVAAPVADTSGTFDLKSLAALLAVSAAGGIFFIVRGALNLGDYRVLTDGSTVRITCGVLKKSEYVFERGRINAVVVRQPVLARIFGLSLAEVAVVGLGNEKNETPQLTLLTTKAETDRILGACSGDFASAKPVEDAHPSCLLWSGIGAAVLSAIAGLVARFAFLAGTAVSLAAASGVLALFLIRGFLGYKTKKIVVDDDVFHYVSGIFSRRRGMFKYGDIQHAELRTNFIMRRFGVATLGLSILSGSKLKNHKTGWFPTESLERVADAVVENRDRDRLAVRTTNVES